MIYIYDYNTIKLISQYKEITVILCSESTKIMCWYVMYTRGVLQFLRHHLVSVQIRDQFWAIFTIGMCALLLKLNQQTRMI